MIMINDYAIFEGLPSYDRNNNIIYTNIRRKTNIFFSRIPNNYDNIKN